MTIDGYLARVRAALHGLPDNQIEEILRELHGHVLERTKETGADVETAIESLGDPEELARMYRTEAVMERAECRNSSLLILNGLFLLSRRSVAGFFVAVAAALGYLWSLALGGAAIDKLFEPGQIGVWYTRGHLWPLELVVNGRGPAASREILGWWFVPIGLGLCAALFVLTKRFGLWWIRRSRRTRQGGSGEDSAM